MVFEGGMPIPDRYASQLFQNVVSDGMWAVEVVHHQKSSSPVDLKHLPVIKVAVLNAAVVINVSGKNSGS